MAQVRRNDIEQADDLFGHFAPSNGYDPGGPVAHLQNDLALRLAADQIALAPADRWVRLISVAGGYTALVTGYAAMAIAIFHWA